MPPMGADVSGSLPKASLDVSAPFVDVNTPSMGVNTPSGSVDMPSVEGGISGSRPIIGSDAFVDAHNGIDGMSPGYVEFDMPDVPDIPIYGDGIPGNLPPAEVKLSTPNVDVEGDDVSLTTGLAAGAVAGLGAIGAGIGLMGKVDKPEGEVRAYLKWPALLESYVLVPCSGR